MHFLCQIDRLLSVNGGNRNGSVDREITTFAELILLQGIRIPVKHDLRAFIGHIMNTGPGSGTQFHRHICGQIDLH